MRGTRTKAVLAAAALAATGCGGGERSESDDGTQTVRIVRVDFPERQHLAQRSTFSLTIKNAGDTTIASVVGTLRGLAARDDDGTRRRLWIAGASQDGGVGTIDDARVAGPLRAGDEATLRWQLTPAAAGTHTLTWQVAAGSRTRVAGGGRPRGSLTVHVDGRAPFARVDPRTGRVIREKSPPSG